MTEDRNTYFFYSCNNVRYRLYQLHVKVHINRILIFVALKKRLYYLQLGRASL